jgi:hypothetical protein
LPCWLRVDGRNWQGLIPKQRTLAPTSKMVDALMLMQQLPSGVDIEIKL